MYLSRSLFKTEHKVKRVRHINNYEEFKLTEYIFATVGHSLFYFSITYYKVGYSTQYFIFSSFKSNYRML
jgi:hypothetical protein